MNATGILISIFFWIILSSGVNANQPQKTVLPFYVPSAVTVESSRTYFNFISQFEKLHPAVNIKLYPLSSYEIVLDTVLKNNKRKQASGVFVAEISELFTLRQQHAILPLDSFLLEDKRQKNHFLGSFIPQFLGNSYADNTLYALPLFRSIPVIYYNLDLLKKVGIPLANLPKNRHELKNLLVQYTEKTKKPALLLANDWYDWIFESMVAQDGGALYTADGQPSFHTQSAINALTFLQTLKNEGLLARSTRAWKATLNSFIYLENYPVIFYSSAGINAIDRYANFKWDTDLIPKSSQYASTQGAGNLFVSNYLSDKQQYYAWEWVKFLTNTPNQVTMSLNSGYFPVTINALKHNDIQAHYKSSFYRQITKEIGSFKAKSMAPNFKELRKVLKQAIIDTLDNKISPSKSLAKAQSKATKLIMSTQNPG